MSRDSEVVSIVQQMRDHLVVELRDIRIRLELRPLDIPVKTYKADLKFIFDKCAQADLTMAEDCVALVDQIYAKALKLHNAVLKGRGAVFPSTILALPRNDTVVLLGTAMKKVVDAHNKLKAFR